MTRRRLEICIDSIASAMAAQAGGADRVELCDNLMEGGTTPSYGLIKMVRERIDIGLQVMIRPRGGDFLYSHDELELMKTDLQVAKELGANGVVFGALNEDGSIDKEVTGVLTRLARPMNVTFHRAFDMVSDGESALEDLIEIGIDRVLTSGLSKDVIAGQEVIKKLVGQASDRITILAGGGIRTHNVRDFVDATKVTEVHASGRKVVESQMKFKNEAIAMGVVPESEYITKVADESMVREFRKLIG